MDQAYANVMHTIRGSYNLKQICRNSQSIISVSHVYGARRFAAIVLRNLRCDAGDLGP